MRDWLFDLFKTYIFIPKYFNCGLEVLVRYLNSIVLLNTVQKTCSYGKIVYT